MSCTATAIWIYLAAFASFAPRNAYLPNDPGTGKLMVVSPASAPYQDNPEPLQSKGAVPQSEGSSISGAEVSSGAEYQGLPHSDPRGAAGIEELQPLPLGASEPMGSPGTGITFAKGSLRPDASWSASSRLIEPVATPRGIRWDLVLAESLFFLGVEHGYRLLDPTQPYTRAALKGPFFHDWFVTVKDLKGWSDNDPFIINYVGHPVQGAVSGRILVQNDPRSKLVMPSFKPEYRRTCLKAFGWAFLYELQFELGPISEASLGNSKGTPQYPHPTSYVDIVITPVVGMGWMIGEDFADRGIARLEGVVRNRPLILLMRTLSNPSRTMANALRIKWPWYRDDRF